MENNLRVCIFGIGEAGIAAVSHVKKHCTLPLVFEKNDVDAIVVLSGVEDSLIENKIIETVNHYQNEKINLLVALKPAIIDAEYLERLLRLKVHTCVVVAGSFYELDSQNWQIQCQFCIDVIEGLFSPFYQNENRQIYCIDLSELIDFLKPTLAIAVYYESKCNQIGDVVNLLKHIKVIVGANNLVFVHVIQKAFDFDQLDIVTEFLFQQFFMDHIVTSTVNKDIQNEIGLFMIFTNQELK